MRKALQVVMAGALGMSALAFAGDSSAGPASAKWESEELRQTMLRGTREMQTMQMSGDVDYDFITVMRKHHQDAIALAEMELELGTDPQARELARRIRDSQKKDLADFRRWLSQHDPQGTGGSGTP
ncbi:DUF305 domain-containing protein [Pyxidicoccus sp. MSG2]|uniref:DUF305 domain-containing protein n=1 Tax=Pyxidicoccus sp. MSG2 TaxID=2996790 RepID=UPI0022700C34|nr:DUF305 domain-containing protein [Pyxidicoccus sp. MSG2]MCY1023995.1 DUF305 domain-containing protein [Pyxidicoccus sp. MSG2]